MGWTANIESDKDIFPEDIHECVLSMPKKLQGHFQMRTDWGWSSGVDVLNPEGNSVELHGSYGLSGDIAEEYAKELMARLVQNGYKIVKCEFNW